MLRWEPYLRKQLSRAHLQNRKRKYCPTENNVQIRFSFRAHYLTTSQLIRKNSMKPFTGVKHIQATALRQLLQKPRVPRISWLIWSFLHPKCCHWPLCCLVGFCQILQTLHKCLQIKQFKGYKWNYKLHLNVNIWTVIEHTANLYENWHCYKHSCVWEIALIIWLVKKRIFKNFILIFGKN